MTAALAAIRNIAAPTSRRVGVFLGPLISVVVYFAVPDVTPSAEAIEAGFANERAAAVTLALIVLMAIWWMLEVVPLAVTALLPIVVFPLTGVNSVGAVTASYGNKVIFLFLGGFILAAAMQRWNLHKHIALRIVLLFGTRPKNLVLGFMLATMLLGMWISNTATAIMMMAIGGSIIGLLRKHDVDCPQLSASLYVGIAYAASISAFGTIIASPPNALLVGYLSENYGIQIGFGQWMLMGVPLSVVFLMIGWFILTHGPFRSDMAEVPDGDAIVRKELERLGPIGSPQRRVLAVFAVTVFLWIMNPLIWPESNLSDEIIAIAAAISFFVIPATTLGEGSLLDWDDTKTVPWGILYLFGGGLALAGEIRSSGLSGWLADQLRVLADAPLVLMVLGVCIATVCLTEFMSNTASAATLIPISAALAIGAGLSPIALALPTTLAASCAFMMPACTPPNAIAVSSGAIRPPELLKAGWMMSLVGIVLVSFTSLFVAPLVMGY